MQADILKDEQTRLLYVGLPSALAVNALLALILVTILRSVIAPSILFGWLTLLGTTLLARAVLLVAWRRSELNDENYDPRWMHRFRIFVITTGMAWGVGAVLLFPAGDAPHQVFLAFVLAGLSAGASTTLAIDRVSMLGFLVPTLLPLVVRFGMEGGEIALAMSAMSALFLILLAMSSERLKHSFNENLLLRVEAAAREEVLSRSEARLRQAQEVAHLGSFDWNPVSGELQWSDEHFRLWGLVPRSATPSYALFRQGIHPDDVAQLEEDLQRALHGGRFYDRVHRVVWPDGSDHYIRGRGEMMFDHAGHAVRMIGTVQDITDYKLVEEALRHSEAKFRTLYDTTSDAVMLLDEKGFFDCNNATLEIFGCATQEEFCSKHPADLSPPVQPCGTDSLTLANQRITTAMKNGSHRFEWMHRRADSGKVFPAEVLLSAMKMDGKPVLQATVRDISERKQDEEALHTAIIAAEAANRAKSEFLASMSHELRTPLNAILGFSQLFGMDPNLTKDTQEQARGIERAGNHLLSLINDLIDLSRIEAGKLAISLEPVLVKPVLADSLELAASIATQQGIEIHHETGDGEMATVLADYVRLRQVVINLLSNAIKYNRPQGTVHLSCRMKEGKVYISVADTGRGIPADKQSRIFSAFDRLGAEGGSIEGTGIGLVITKRLVEAMGGSIGFESTEGQGSTFWVELPASKAAALPTSEAAALAPVPETTPQSKARPVVLYIEDNPMNLHLMQQIFKRKELELRDALTAEIGIELARAEPPALILMDINLPGMDGYEALKVLKADARTAHIPVVAITANAMVGDEERGLAAGFVAYFTKPLDISSLYDSLGKLIVKPEA